MTEQDDCAHSWADSDEVGVHCSKCGLSYIDFPDICDDTKDYTPPVVNTTDQPKTWNVESVPPPSTVQIHPPAAVDYWDRQPCNSRHSSLEKGSLAYFDEVRRKRYFVEYHIPEFAEFGKYSGKHVLDVGCGIGTDLTSFALAGAAVTGVDQSQASCVLAHQQVAQYDVNTRVSITRCPSAAWWPIEANTVDLAWSFGVLHHMPEHEMHQAIRKMHRSLKPGGEIKIMVYHKWSTKWFLCMLGLMQPEAQTGCPIVRAYTRRQGTELLRAAGFENIKTQVKHVFPWAITPYKAGQYRRSWQWYAQPFESFVGWHLMIKATKPLE